MKTLGVWGLIVLTLAISIFLSGCATHIYEGAGVGGVLGGIAGALIDHKNPWRGAVIGAAIGGATGAAISDISTRAAEKAANQNQATIERNGNKTVLAEPMQPETTECKKIRIREWDGNLLKKDEVKEICNSKKTENTYLN